jgi:hypothetical protein
MRTFTSEPGVNGSRSVREVVEDISDHSRELLRAEIDLAKQEVADGIKQLLPAVALVVTAAAMIATVVILLGHAIAMALNNVMDAGLAYLLTGVIYAAIAGGFVLLARERVKGASIVPTEAAKRTKEDARWIATHARN